MAGSFWRSKEFAISLTVALLIVAAGVIAVSTVDGEVVLKSGCTPPGTRGTPIEARISDAGVTRAANGYERVVTYEMDAAQLRAGSAFGCTRVGDARVMPSPDGIARVTFTITARSFDAPDVIDATRVDAVFETADDALHVRAWTASGSAWRVFGSESHVHVALTVQLPMHAGAWDATLASDVGTVHATDVLLRDARLSSDVGDVRVSGTDLQGNLTASADVGSVNVRLASVGPGKIRVTTDVGDASLEIPQRPDVGYAVHVTTDVGDASVDIGDTEQYESKSSGPSETVAARSRGYGSKPTRVEIRVTTDVGSASVVAR